MDIIEIIGLAVCLFFAAAVWNIATFSQFHARFSSTMPLTNPIGLRVLFGAR